ncbi:hypothetical protein [Streptomyces sp. Wb2n-11]|uniref:hypothetical protein n=1 Tax=Streptomyces sp. Wb2n-11 TaxID=1030533 RepID=UPI000AF435F3|nr:hypothetical protein [Streptomyces sp. Wb2n-11]
MAGEITPSRLGVEHFGENASEVVRHVVTGLARGQKAARLVQVAAEGAGAADKRPYGSMWATRYHLVVSQFDLASLPGYEPYRPKGASYSLAVVNGRVLIPFRHATSLKEPITRAKLSTKIPQMVSRDNGVDPAPTLFDTPEAAGPEAHPTVAEAAAAAKAEKLQVIYVAYVANADSDEILAAWWGTPHSLEDDGTMLWEPERLDMSIATAQDSGSSRRDLHDAGVAIPTQGWARGEVPSLDVTPRVELIKRPSAEQEPTTPQIEDGNE